jgi:hypothetical protein
VGKTAGRLGKSAGRAGEDGGEALDLALPHPGADAEREHCVVARRGVLEQRADLLGGQRLQPARWHARQ